MDGEITPVQALYGVILFAVLKREQVRMGFLIAENLVPELTKISLYHLSWPVQSPRETQHARQDG